MNRFTHNKSKIFLALAWLFVAALFADGANLGDLIPGTIVMHSDEDNDSQTDFQLLVNVSSNTPVHSRSLPTNHQRQHEQQPKVPLRIVYDQDSDSLAAEAILASESFVMLPPEAPLYIESAIPTQSLYLLHCTLLI